ncbi:MAG: archease [Nitrososphaerota archaeon]|nr:archease [Nitrososphaerota archaeon]
MDGSGRRFLEHMSDVYVEAYGQTMEDAFKEAGLAVFDIISDTKDVKPEVKKEVYAEGFDMYSLLYNWLEQLLLLFELEGFLASDIEVHAIEKSDDAFRIRATVTGEKFNPSRHKHGIGIKSVTYALMEILEGDVKRVRFVLDI